MGSGFLNDSYLAQVSGARIVMASTMILILGILSVVSGQIMEGMVQLDKFSIDKVLGAFEFSLVKFDAGYPTGEKHKGFGAFALQSVGLPNLLPAEVRIKDYGDKANQDHQR